MKEISTVKVNGKNGKTVEDSSGKHMTYLNCIPFFCPTWNENHDPTDIWWDIENCSVPGDIDPEHVYQKIVYSLRRRNYKGPVTIKAIFAKTTVNISLDLLEKLSPHIKMVDLEYYTQLPPVDAADGAIVDDITDFVIKNAPPHNIMVLSADGFFEEILKDLQSKGYRTLGSFKRQLGSPLGPVWNDFVFDSWLWRDLLGLELVVKPKEEFSKPEIRDLLQPYLLQPYCVVSAKNHLPALVYFLKKKVDSKVTVYFLACSSVLFVAAILEDVVKIPCLVIHGGLDLDSKLETLRKFKAAGHGVLLCSDPVFLGYTSSSLGCLVRYDFPDSLGSYVCDFLRPIQNQGGEEGLLILNEQQRQIIASFEQHKDIYVKEIKFDESQLSTDRSLFEARVADTTKLRDLASSAFQGYLAQVQVDKEKNAKKKKKSQYEKERTAITAASFLLSSN